MMDLIQTLCKNVINFYLDTFTRYRYRNNFQYRTEDDVFDNFEPNNRRSAARIKYYE